MKCIENSLICLHALLPAACRNETEYLKSSGSRNCQSFFGMLVIFALSCSFGFLFTTNTWFFIVLALPDLLLNTGFRTAAFKTTQCAVQCLVFFDDHICHCPELTSLRLWTCAGNKYGTQSIISVLQKRSSTFPCPADSRRPFLLISEAAPEAVRGQPAEVPRSRQDLCRRPGPYWASRRLFRRSALPLL